VVGAVVATDPEGDTITYSIVSGDDYSAFAIDSSSGVVTVDDNLDYETENLHVLTIGLEDDGSPVATSQTTIAIQVTDVEETTTDYKVENAIPDVDGWKKGRTWIYTIPSDTFTEPETGHELTYEASYPTSWMQFDESTGTFLYFSGNASPGTHTIDVTAVYTTTSGEEVDRVTDSFDFEIVASLDLEILDALQYLEGDGLIDGLPEDGEAMIMVADAEAEPVEDGENLADILALLEMTDVDVDMADVEPADVNDEVDPAAAAIKTEEKGSDSARA
jgi:hypothetical protein